MIRNYLAVFVLFLFIMQVPAQTGHLSGTISCNGEAIRNCKVSIVSAHLSTTSDSSGKYNISDISPGLYKIVFSSLAYLEQELQVIIKAGEMSLLDVTMTTNALELKAVQVTGSKNTTPTISKLDMQLRPLSSSQDLLRMVPGLFIAQHAGGGKAEQIFLRGFDVDHGTDFAIYVDGIPVNMPSHAHGQGYADLHFLIPETVKELEVNKGPFAVAYGDLATAGSGEFRTLTTLDKNMVKTEAGMFGTKRVLAMYNLLNGRHLLSKKQEYLYVAGELKITDSYFQNKQHFYRANAFAKYTGELKRGGQLTLSLSTFQSRWDASGQVPDRKVEDGSISRFGSIDPTEGGQTGRTNFNVLHEKKWGKLTLKNQLFYSRYDFNLYSNFTFFLKDTVNGDQINQVDRRNVMGCNSTLRSVHNVWGHNLTSTIGVGVRYDQSLIALSHTVRRAFLDSKVAGRLNQVNTWIYADENYAISSKLRLNFGARADIYNFDFRNTHYDSASGVAVKMIVSPKASLFYTLHKNVQLFFKSGFGFHSNDARAVVVGQLENTLAKACGNEIGAAFKPAKRLVANVALWTLDLQSELVYVGDEGIVEATGRTRRVGIDLGMRYQLAKYLFIDADVNINEGHLRDEPSDANRIPLAPAFTSTGGITLKKPAGWNASLRYRTMGNRAAIEDNSIIAKGYFLTDAAVSYNYKKWTIGVSAENLLNRKWKEAQFATESRLKGEQRPVNEIHFTPGTPLFLKGVLTYSF